MFDAKRYLEYEEGFTRFNELSFVLEAGEGNVMLSAPHAVEQTRKGRIKYAEPQTGALVKMLRDELKCPIIYKTRNCGDDANFDSTCDYKSAIVEYVQKNEIQLLLDLHQLSPSRELLVDVGTGNMQNVIKREYLDITLQSFFDRGIANVQVDKLFNAKGLNTISSYVARCCNITCLQLEMHSNLVRFGYTESNVEGVYEALKKIIQTVGKK